MNKKGMLITVSSFLVMIGFIALFSLIQTQQDSVFDEMTMITTIDSTLDIYDSIERTVKKTSNSFFAEAIDSKNIMLYIKTPISTSETEVGRFTDFIIENSRFDINHSFDFSELNILPYDIPIKKGSGYVSTEPSNSTVSVIEGYSVTLYWDGSTKPMNPSLSTKTDGINFTVFLYANKGQTLRTLQGFIDPQKNSTVDIELYSDVNYTTGRKDVKITIQPPGELKVDYGTANLEIEQKTTLSANNHLQVKYKKAELVVNNTELGVSKEGEVRI